MTSIEVREKIAAYLAKNPGVPYRVVADKLHCSISAIAAIAREFKITRQNRNISEDDLTHLFTENGGE